LRRKSASNPPITDRTTTSAITPVATPAMDIDVMNDNPRVPGNMRARTERNWRHAIQIKARNCTASESSKICGLNEPQ
jgi:hypothetical protein